MFGSALNMTKISSSLLLLGLFCLSSSLLPVLYATDGETESCSLSEERLWALFDSWAANNSKSYGEEEKAHRLSVFRDNLEYINTHNSRYPAPSFTLGLNAFADLTNKEFQALKVGKLVIPDERVQRRLEEREWTESRHKHRERRGRTESRHKHRERKECPHNDCVDWRKKGVVTPVKNQGNCGSCWSFSTIAAIEGAHAIATGQLISLSEQELVDCDTSNNGGCNGGWMDNAFQFIIGNGGIDSEADYPYTATQGTCDNSKLNTRVVSISAFVDVPPNNEGSLVQAVAKQPVSVAIDASGTDFQLYTSGVFTGSCGVNLDHAVTVVGYCSDGVLDYWIIKNSWGVTWGESGYIRMQRSTGTTSGICGILSFPSYPVT
ncbi:unnamed protein product [Calypogeia fissa]